MDALFIILVIIFSVPILCFTANILTIWWIKRDLKKREGKQ